MEVIMWAMASLAIIGEICLVIMLGLAVIFNVVEEQNRWNESHKKNKKK